MKSRYADAPRRDTKDGTVVGSKSSTVAASRVPPLVVGIRHVPAYSDPGGRYSRLGHQQQPSVKADMARSISILLYSSTPSPAVPAHRYTMRAVQWWLLHSVGLEGRT